MCKSLPSFHNKTIQKCKFEKKKSPNIDFC